MKLKEYLGGSYARFQGGRWVFLRALLLFQPTQARIAASSLNPHLTLKQDTRSRLQCPNRHSFARAFFEYVRSGADMSLRRDILHMRAQYNEVHRCSTMDPCADGTSTCPSKKLCSASFSLSNYGDILPLDCNNEKGASIWYTCNSTSPPFLGCYKSDPCGASCAQADLAPAMLSTDIAARGVFLLTALTVSDGARTF